MSDMPDMPSLKYVDLFSGMGSFHYSFKKLGFECVMASDNYRPAQLNYEKNYGLSVMGDIRDIDPAEVPAYDILCAGFPCQPFSQAGHHKGFGDSRGTMFYEVMRFVKINKPAVVVLENVPALVNHDKGRTFMIIKQELRSEGYALVFKVLKCSDYGLPQMRKRLFVVCFKQCTVDNLDDFFNLQEYESKTTLTAYLGQDFEKDTAYTIRCGGRHSPIDDRHNWDGYWVRDGSERREYRLTINDALRLQGFIGYELEGKNSEKWKMLGNTIPTIFTEMIGRKIVTFLSNAAKANV